MITLKYAIFAYVAWGLFPAYWNLLHDLPALEILCHRIVWAIVFYSTLLFFRGVNAWDCLRLSKKIWCRMAICACLLFGNWYLYIFAVNSGHIVESSLGYFISPLVNVALGVLVLHEPLSRFRWLALALAVVGVAWLTFLNGSPPWIALALAFTFGLYGFMRKTTPVESVQGGQIETILMLIPVCLTVLLLRPDFCWPNYTLTNWFFLMGAGIVTGLPLVWFAEAAQIVPLNLLGFAQYISPMMQFLLGILTFHEVLGRERLGGFIFIWIALIVFGFDLWRGHIKYSKVRAQ
jgi:chloramphenicol-sensitive protein RarD